MAFPPEASAPCQRRTDLLLLTDSPPGSKSVCLIPSFIARANKVAGGRQIAVLLAGSSAASSDHQMPSDILLSCGKTAGS